MKLKRIPRLCKLTFQGLKAVYFLCLNSEVVYVGRTNNLHQRVQQHGSRIDFDEVFYLKDVELNETEKKYISEYRPKHNAIPISLNVRVSPKIHEMLSNVKKRTGKRFQFLIEEAIMDHCSKSKLKAAKKGQP